MKNLCRYKFQFCQIFLGSIMLSGLISASALAQNERYRYAGAEYPMLEQAEEAMRNNYPSNAGELVRFEDGDVYDEEDRILQMAYRPAGAGAQMVDARLGDVSYFRSAAADHIDGAGYQCDDCPLMDEFGNDLCELNDVVDRTQLRRLFGIGLPAEDKPTDEGVAFYLRSLSGPEACIDKNGLEIALRDAIAQRKSYSRADCRYQLQGGSDFDDPDNTFFAPFLTSETVDRSVAVRIRSVNVEASLLIVEPGADFCQQAAEISSTVAYDMNEITAAHCPQQYPVMDTSGRCSRPLVMIEVVNPPLPVAGS